ncbi:adenosine receptor A3-like [Littorina saxatilis]|uniref:adenosine receptor A3-like n=1 Tax=Littorina saxatilis TaxID=31220 RepID=UPI0038B4DFEC
MAAPEPEEMTDVTSSSIASNNVTGGRSGGGSLLSFAVAQPFIWFFMFFSNLAVLVVYRRYLGFNTLTNYFVYNIAVADLCMSFNMLVQMLFFIWPTLSTSEYLCLFRMELMTFFTTVSLLSGFFATIDRFMIIVVNRHYHTIMSTYNVKLMIAFAWFYSFCFAAVPFFANNWDTVRRCEFVTVVPAGYIVFGSCQTIVSTIVEIVLYVAIFYVAGRRRRQFKRDLNQSTISGRGACGRPGAPKEQQSLRGAKFMGVVLITYSLCWWPFAVLGYIQIYMYHPTLTMVRMVMVYLGISNSLLNPLLYAWQKKDFRDGLRRLLGLHNRQARVHTELSTRRTSVADGQS